ncbi:MAG: hypothetical protein K0U34_06080 [Alphaproteobacteria bacterium]|nr:hypothetical protein [Alphaproteobacteria bacterium]
MVCYAALVLALIGLACLILPFAFSYCRESGGGAMACDAPIYRQLFEFGFAIVMFGAFTGVPAGLAAGGVGFLLRDVWAWFTD